MNALVEEYLAERITVGGLVLGLAGGWLGEITQSGPRAAALRRVVRGV